jgi:hypothetical protein
MRRTRHRRRFHTDRIVANRRARLIREESPWNRTNWPDWISARMAYGRLADRDPWDCGHTRCGCCHWYKYSGDHQRRRREERLWRQDWGV